MFRFTLSASRSGNNNSLFPKGVIFLLVFVSHHPHLWTTNAFRGKIVNEADSLFHFQWSQGSPTLKWDEPVGTPSMSDSTSASASSSATTSSSASSHHATDAAEEWLHILSADDEPYQCSIPKSRGNTKERSQVYDGPSPLNILNQLFQKGSCSYRIESYWTYEVCHGKYIRQVGC